MKGVIDRAPHRAEVALAFEVNRSGTQESCQSGSTIRIRPCRTAFHDTRSSSTDTVSAPAARSVEYLLITQIFKQWSERVRRSKNAQYGLFFTATGIRGAA